MKRFLTIALCAFLAFSFVMAVLTYGTDEKYSIMAHIEYISEEFSQTPSFAELTDYWLSESFTPSYGGVQFYPSFGGGANSGGGFGGGIYSEYPIYPEKVTDGDWGALQPLQEFVGSVKGFFVRLYYSFVWICNFIYHVFLNVAALLPWNGFVERGEVVTAFYK